MARSCFILALKELVYYIKIWYEDYLPKTAPMRRVTLLCKTKSARSARAGSHSLRTPQLTRPKAIKAPAQKHDQIKCKIL